MSTTAVSAPGKVLLAGGYLVVDREHTGLVFGLSARVHVHIQTIPTSDGVSLSEIIVRSPQFRDAEWRYTYRLAEEDKGVAVLQLKGHTTNEQSRNKFVETALQYALTYISYYGYTLIKPATITIVADGDYYSQADTATTNEAVPDSRFQNFNVTLTDAHKTGLGSSAALVTALVGAILSHFLAPDKLDLSTDDGRKRVHNLAQAAHCQAQGKIGSGFDVAAAVYGSCIYRRFSPSVLNRAGEVGVAGFTTKLATLVNDERGDIWDTKIQAHTVQMPDGLKLVMCDVDCGSETPGMVKKVFAWRKEHHEEAKRLWDALQAEQEQIVAELVYISKNGLEKAGYNSLRHVLQRCGALVREMSEKSGVPIEPRVQTQLLDACVALDGVVGGVVPGAGGYDALALIIEDNSDAQRRLEAFLSSYIPLPQEEGPAIGKVKLLGVKQESEGIRKENRELYSGWV